MSWELIIADDGSKDATWKLIQALHQQDKMGFSSTKLELKLAIYSAEIASTPLKR